MLSPVSVLVNNAESSVCTGVFRESDDQYSESTSGIFRENNVESSVCTGVFRESDDEYSDDDDMSWKVRRSAAKCVEAIISTRHEMLAEFYRTVSPALIARFKGTYTLSPVPF